MASLNVNLKSLMSGAKINASELARRTGIAQPIIHRLSTGQNTNPKLATIKPIAHYFAVTVSQLIGEDPLPNEQPQLTERSSWNRVPVISWKDAVKWPETISQYQQAENVVYVPTDAKVSNLAYSLVVKGRVMEPVFPEGTTLIVEPKRKPNNRDFVVVHTQGEEEAQLKQVIIDGDNRYLKSISTVTDKDQLTRFSSKDQFLGVMAQAKVDY